MSSTPRPRRSRRRQGSELSAASRGSRIRWTKVMVAQARLASGYYDRPEVQDYLVDALWVELQRQ